MSKPLPYMAQAGAMPKILNKIIEASVPETFNADFLGTKLGFPGGNQRTFISWAKKCGLLNSDGSPTQIYKNFRNPSSRGSAMAEAIRHGYSEAYTRNAYAHDLKKSDFIKLVSEITGSPHDNSTVKAIVSSFFHAKSFADFEKKVTTAEPEKAPNKESSVETNVYVSDNNLKGYKLGLNYTINLVLPKTDDPAVFNAIFKSLKENLLDE